MNEISIGTLEHLSWEAAVPPAMLAGGSVLLWPHLDSAAISFFL